MLVSLEELVSLAPDQNQVYDSGFGQEAVREANWMEWMVQNADEGEPNKA